MIAESSTDTNNSHKFSLLHNSIPETTVHALSGWTPVFILIIALPVIALFATIIHFGVNIPYQDDYNAVFDFLNRFTSTADLQEKARLLFDNHNEHRIAFARVIIYGCYRVMGFIDFCPLMLIGDLSIIVLIFTLYRGMRITERKLFAFLPVTFLLCQPQYYEAITWAQVSLSNLWVYALVFLSFQFLTRSHSKLSVGTGLALALIATYTHGNGMLSLFIGFLCLFQQRQVRTALIWFAIMVPAIGLYFHNWNGPHGNYTVTLQHPIQATRFFFAFIGSTLGHTFIPGFLCFALFLLLTLTRYDRKNAGVYFSLLFLFATAAVAAVTRSHESVEYAGVSRYRFVSTLFLVTTYIACIEWIGPVWRRRLWIPAFILVIVFNVLSYWRNIPQMREEREARIWSVEEWARTGKPDHLFHNMVEAASSMMSKSINRGIYRFPKELVLGE